jgi:hypothetical protein
VIAEAVVLTLVAGLCAASAALLARPLRETHTEHTLAGRFGERPREALIGQWADVVIRTAERYERLDDFQHRLRARAFAGTPLQIDPGPGAWCDWRFDDGEVWHVRHDHRPPRALRRLIVGGACDDGVAGLMVRTYIPGSRDLELPVVDARPA